MHTTQTVWKRSEIVIRRAPGHDPRARHAGDDVGLCGVEHGDDAGECSAGAVAVLVRQASPSAALKLRGLITPPQCERSQAHSRSGRQVRGRVAALLYPLRDKDGDTRDDRQKPDRSGSLADSGRIFPLGMQC